MLWLIEGLTPLTERGERCYPGWLAVAKEAHRNMGQAAKLLHVAVTCIASLSLLKAIFCCCPVCVCVSIVLQPSV